jgi:hypothetical protein
MDLLNLLNEARLILKLSTANNAPKHLFPGFHELEKLSSTLLSINI